MGERVRAKRGEGGDVTDGGTEVVSLQAAQTVGSAGGTCDM